MHLNAKKPQKLHLLPDLQLLRLNFSRGINRYKYPEPG